MRSAIALLVVCCLIVACDRYGATPKSSERLAAMQMSDYHDSTVLSASTDQSVSGQEFDNGRNATPAEGGDVAAKATAQTLNVDQKIIYTANLRVTVENFDPIPNKVNEIVQAHGGYISETRVGQLQGTRRSGAWKIRVPAARYRDFLQSASGLGVPDSLQENAQDVSEEYVDLEARIASGKKLEESVATLLQKYSGKIEDLVAIERELARIRLENERMEGKLRFLANRVAMSTVDLSVAEQTTYVSSEQPALGNRLKLEWSEAVGRMGRFLERLLLGIVANTFVIITWIVLSVIALTVYRIVRRRVRRPTITTQPAT